MDRRLLFLDYTIQKVVVYAQNNLHSRNVAEANLRSSFASSTHPLLSHGEDSNVLSSARDVIQRNNYPNSDSDSHLAFVGVDKDGTLFV